MTTSSLAKIIFGRLSLDSIPYHEPILIGTFAGVAVGGALGLTSGTVLCGAVVGGVTGTVNGAAMGFASGFAGGKNNGLKDIMLKVLVGAITGLALGAALGAVSGMVAPKQSLGDAARGMLNPPSPPPAGPPGVPAAPALSAPASASTAQGTLSILGGAAAGKVGGTFLPYVLAWLAPAAGNGLVQAVIVDGGSAAVSGFFDDIQEYVRTHNVNLGPFNFIKTDF